MEVGADLQVELERTAEVDAGVPERVRAEWAAMTAQALETAQALATWPLPRHHGRGQALGPIR